MQLSSNQLEIIIEGLLKIVHEEKQDYDILSEKSYALYEFMTAPGNIEIAIKWINFVYERFPQQAKEFVASLHDETIDLSTLDCCGEDFIPWEA